MRVDSQVSSTIEVAILFKEKAHSIRLRSLLCRCITDIGISLLDMVPDLDHKPILTMVL